MNALQTDAAPTDNGESVSTHKSRLRLEPIRIPDSW